MTLILKSLKKLRTIKNSNPLYISCLQNSLGFKITFNFVPISLASSQC